MPFLRKTLGFDLRSLALFRVILALFFLRDVLFRVEFEGPLGIAHQIALAFSLISFLFGFFTLWITPAISLLLVPLEFQFAIPKIYFYGAALLPLGAIFSLDRALHEQAPQSEIPQKALSIANLAILAVVAYPPNPIVLAVVTPTTIWDWIAKQIKSLRPTEVALYFDGECLICRKLIFIIREFLLFSQATVQPAQTDPEIHAVMERENSWVVRDPDGATYLRFEGIIRVTEASPLFFWVRPLLVLPPIRRLGDLAYRWFADHRTVAAPFLPSIRERRVFYGEAWGWQILAFSYLLYTFWWSIQTVIWMVETGKIPAWLLQSNL